MRRITDAARWAALLFAATTTLAAASTTPPGSVAGHNRPLGELPGSWLGDLPCADCAGTRHQLDLFSDGVFHLRIEYLGEERSFDQVGEWTLADEDRLLVLDPAGPAPMRLRLLPEDGLRMLDREGREIESRLNYDLARIETIEPFTPDLELEGIYHLAADREIFGECLTGRELSVRPGPGRDSLVAVVRGAGFDPATGLKLRLRGRIITSPATAKDAAAPDLLVDRLLALHPGESCGARGSRSDLEGTYWKLTRLGETAVLAGPDEREAFLTLDGGQGRMSASAGCNRLMGSYERNGKALSFGTIAGTKMACPGPLMEREREFTAALARVRGWRLARHTLELVDEHGAVVARFEASERR